MRNLDFHVHCNSDTPEDLENLAAAARRTGSYLALSGGLHYGSHDFVPNDEVLAISRRYPDVFLPLAKFELWDTVDVDLIHRWKDAGFKGVKFIYPYYEYDHDLYMPIYEACEKCDLPILFHTGGYRSNPEDIHAKRPVLKNMSPLNLDRIARSFQRLHIVMAHLGTRVYREQAAELIRMHANLYADLAGCGSWMGVTPELLHQLMEPFPPLFRGADQFGNYGKLVFGSDGYANDPEAHLSGISYYERALELNAVPKEIIRKIMGGTVAAWLGVKLD